MNNIFFKKAICVTTLVLLVTTTFSTAALSQQNETTAITPMSKATCIVDNEGDGDYTTIAEAIEDASAGDTIEVYSGTYIENIEIHKEITLTGIDSEYENGTDAGKPIINGNNTGDIITIFTEEHNDPVTISGFNITNSGKRDSGIFVDFSIDVSIAENIFSNNHHGIYVYHSRTTIEENTFINNDRGILTEFSDHCIVTENIFDNNDIGFQLESSHALSINRNWFTNNTEHGIVLIRSPINDVSFNNFENNGVNAWFKNCWNKWNDNYWSKTGILPFYIIIGEFQSTIFPALRIPYPQFDLRAKKTPN